jgi:hypothetical protein
MRREGWLNAAAVVLLALTCLRMALVVLHNPVTGYANNLDFFRQSACVGLWENYTDRPLISADLDAPVGDLVYTGHRLHESCVNSSDNIFVWVAAHLYGKHAHVPLQAVGTAKMLAAWATMLFVLAQPTSAAFRLICVSAIGLVFGDIAVLTYFNTLYVDASGLIVGTAAVALIGAICARRRAPGWRFCAGLSACVVWLGAVKPQYAPLALLQGLVAAYCLMVFWRDRAQATCLVAAALVAALIFQLLNPAGKPVMMAMHGVNNADSFLGAVLPQAADRAAALVDLGLPAGCAQAVAIAGNGMPVRPAQVCPQITGVSRLRLLPLFIHQPNTLLAPLEIGIWGSRPSYLWFPHFGRAADAYRLQFRVLHATSLSTFLAWLPFSTYRWGLLTICGAGVCLALPLLLAMWTKPSIVRRYPEAGFLALGGGECFYALFSSVFGDGFSELARHTAALLVGMGFFLPGVFSLVVRVSWKACLRQ